MHDVDTRKPGHDFGEQAAELCRLATRADEMADQIKEG